ncbi:dTDP-4-dehydrorhamnose 3,5-epimerase [Paracoccus tegillarcae]|uniref:dTDP-4-dehydrorhamnose 3,5-epimerase n=1 Tax=Paracoccus tegillarcae TaxID=1529068 RepID=A0A2K9EPN1_9RHOB|nr:dTDP-4-dehydrorhamnose 3,5-epimerase [Paracoccus tegillarcae]AUH33605.1 dTDP-4-dehydrorhamnose 3,5-epimerase [Paracoccus tegillarcae]
MQIEQTGLSGALIVTPARHGDDRGFFSESWNRKTLREAGVDLPEFVQDNHSLSRKQCTLRGLHYQAPPHAQGKLVRCGRGSLFDVAVDARRGSPTFGRWFGTELSFENGRQLWVPAGFLHGFVTLEPDTEVVYKCTDHYDRDSDSGVHWDSVGVEWAVSDPVLSDKDRSAPAFADWQSPFEFGEY